MEYGSPIFGSARTGGSVIVLMSPLNAVISEVPKGLNWGG